MKYPIYYRFMSPVAGFGFIARKKTGYELVGEVDALNQKKAPGVFADLVKTAVPHDEDGYNILLRETCSSVTVRISNSTYTGGFKIIGKVNGLDQINRYQIMLNAIDLKLEGVTH